MVTEAGLAPKSQQTHQTAITKSGCTEISCEFSRFASDANRQETRDWDENGETHHALSRQFLGVLRLNLSAPANCAV